jgi:hypothetical protein
MAKLTWEAIVAIEPRLGWLLKEVRSIRGNKQQRRRAESSDGRARRWGARHEALRTEEGL